ncbi:MAG TPA: long-chain fatty acid--CoA ligase [Burkholderiales bacterium]|nr:long-chain fatty acid--CoA ligase [Burkholderiales bacterium]
MNNAMDVISPESARTLDGLFAERVRRTPDAPAYYNFDEGTGQWVRYTWAETENMVGRWQIALEKEGLPRGERVAMMMRNSVWWVVFDQAAMGLDLVTVPLYTSDRPENIAYILHDAGVRVLFLESDEVFAGFGEVASRLADLKRIVCLKPLRASASDPRLVDADHWLPRQSGPVRHFNADGDRLASIIYTSGTTGRPKGVMLSHQNMLQNAYATLQCFPTGKDDLFLSFLPLSHTLERTCGYYGTLMSGAQTAFARSVQQLREDLQAMRPTVLISVPRIYERVYGAIKQKLDEGPAFRRRLFRLATDVGWARFEHSQGRGPWKASFLLWPILKKLVASKVMAQLGGRLRAATCGGAALSPDVAKLFIGLGLPVIQGYGLTETSPVVSTNRMEDNVPASIGKPIPGVQVKIGDSDALLVKGPNVMLGYWNNPEATRAMFTEDGWLNTGDTARIDETGHIYITGRLKEIIVMSNGEKIPPVDMESAILRDPLFEQVMVLGEGRPFLSAFVVLNREQWARVAAAQGLDPASERVMCGPQAEKIVLERLKAQIHEFPGYAQIHRAAVFAQPWTIENGLLTPTMKVKRAKVVDSYRREFDALYAGH